MSTREPVHRVTRPHAWAFLALRALRFTPERDATVDLSQAIGLLEDEWTLFA